MPFHSHRSSRASADSAVIERMIENMPQESYERHHSIFVEQKPSEVVIFLIGISLFIFFSGFAIYIYFHYSGNAERTMLL